MSDRDAREHVRMVPFGGGGKLVRHHPVLIIGAVVYKVGHGENKTARSKTVIAIVSLRALTQAWSTWEGDQPTGVVNRYEMKGIQIEKM